MAVVLGRTVVADWSHNSDQGLLHKIGWLSTFGSTRSTRNIVAVGDYAAVDSALPSLEVLQKGVDFRAFVDHP